MSWLVLLIVWLVLLALGGAAIELVRARPDRRWLRRLHRIERGRAAQRSEP